MNVVHLWLMQYSYWTDFTDSLKMETKSKKSGLHEPSDRLPGAEFNYCSTTREVMPAKEGNTDIDTLVHILIINTFLHCQAKLKVHSHSNVSARSSI